MTIIPSPGPRPTVAPRTSPIVVSSYTVASGETIYSTSLFYLFESDTFNFLSPLINNGTIWSNVSSDFSTVFYIGRYNNLRTVENHGLIVLEAGPDTNRRAVAFEEAGQLTNTGQILVFNEGHGSAIAWDTSLGLHIDNSGTIGARSVNGYAQAIGSYNGGHVINRAGGSILAEGKDAIAIYLGRGEHPAIVGPPQLENAGRIEAVSLDLNLPSVGVFFAGFSSEHQTVLNTGVIKADIALYSTPDAGTTAQSEIENILNEPGGLIQGLIWLDRGNDSIRNRGTIEGDVYLGEGNDSFDNDGGTLNGYADLGLNDDAFTGSAGTDYVGGGSGNDSLQGNGGEDILLGGWNDDTLIGGGGNDSLFGEWGKDRIVTQGADFVLGGSGDDRIEAGDLAFEVIDGETGFDTLVLPGGPRTLDLAAAIASNRLFGIEEIVLGDNQGLVVRYSDVAALTDGAHQLVVSGNATSMLSLVGTWTEGSTVSFRGVTYRSFASGDATVLIQQGAGAQVSSNAPAATGLDPVAGGPLALLPDLLTDPVSFYNEYDLTQATHVNAEEIWLSDDGLAVIIAWDSHATLTNDGQIFSSNLVTDHARAVDGRNLESLVNNGSIIAEAGSPTESFPLDQTWAVITSASFGTAQNFGLIQATSGSSRATGAEVHDLVNAGTIIATSSRGEARGAHVNGSLDNSGTIRATGVQPLQSFLSDVSATGVYMRHGGTLTNSGLIEANGAHGAAGITYGFTLTINNSGTIRSNDYAILFPFFDLTTNPLTLVNTGQIIGAIKLTGSTDSITNKGLIDGAVMLGGGDDLFDGREGGQTGIVDGGAGVDQLLGGSGADRFVGGAGADILQGFGGADIFIYRDVSDSTSGAMDRIRQFETGVDKIDLSAFAGAAPTWIELTDPSDSSLYTLLSLSLPGGTLTIRIDGKLAAGDFYQPPQILGTDGPDILNGTTGPDDMFGKAGNDQLFGFNGNDKMDGGGGDDLLDGGVGGDAMTGGAGNDVYIVDNGGDSIVELPGGGTDEVRTASTFSLALIDNVENLVGLGDVGQDLAGNGGNNLIDGGLGADTMRGGGGDDVYLVDNAGDQVTEFFGEGSDEVRTALSTYTLPYQVERLIGASPTGQVLTGNDSNNHISGGLGNDRIDGGIGSDTMVGGAGDDIYWVDGLSDVVVEQAGEGTDEVRTSLASYALAANVENLTGLAGSGVNGVGQSLTGNGGANVITGGNGNDMLDGGAAADTMKGGMGNDIYVVDVLGDTVVELIGGGSDEIRTGLASYALGDNLENLTGTSNAGQLLTGNGGANVIVGGGGSDVLDGGAGADMLAGGLGSDIYIVDNGDMVSELAGQGTDEIRTGLLTYTLGNDVENLTGTSSAGQWLTGNGAANLIVGGGGDDILNGGGGADTLRGGLGGDIYYLDEAGDSVIELAGEGNDAVRTLAAAYVLPANVEYLDGESNSGQALTGNELANIINGRNGNDLIDGGLGADDLRGGLGNDIFVVDNVGDSITEFAGEGSDEVRTGLASYTLGANLENLTGTSGAGQTLTGNGLANIIAGGNGNDLLDGGAGADQLAGGAGNDIYYLDDAGDGIMELAGQGTDEVRTLLASGSLAFLPNFENITGLGNIDQILTGNASANVIDGGLGADHMNGGAGNDIYFVDNGGDTIGENGDEGTDEVRTGLASYSIAGIANVELLTGIGSGDQSLTGNSGDNVIDGGFGADTMTGGLGNDIYYIDNVGDVVVENGAEGSDEIRTSLSSFSLLTTANVERLIGTSNGAHLFRGNGADNVISGAGGNDQLFLQDGGADTANGGGGDDIVYFGGSLDVGDLVDGGAGARDVLVLQGNYNLGLVGGTMSGIEFLSLQSGSVTRFGDTAGNLYDYNLTLTDANVGAGVQLVVNAQSLLASEDLTFDGSAELDGRFLVYGGHGVDTLKGGAGNDIFFFEGARFGSSDAVDGGGGRDSLVIAGQNGLNHIEFGETALTSIESISVNNRFATDPSAVPIYELVLHDGNVAANTAMTINASSLGGSQTVNVDAHLETDGAFNMFGGGGHDVFVGGAKGDLIYAAGGADTLTGGAGGDTFQYRSHSDSAIGASDRITDFTSGSDRIDLSFIDANAAAPGDQAFVFIGSSAFTGHAGELRAAFDAGANAWTVSGDLDGDGFADFLINVNTAIPDPIVGADFIL